ncbi:MAG: cation diffusion facilitator family transporter [Alphaproteobacteria bacterium]|nr:cation diffusion facilitator family transporter [Alphaproteobacteria bacterium]
MQTTGSPLSHSDSERRRQDAALVRRATHVAVAVAGVLIVAKLAAWLASDSVAMLSSLIDSSLDAGASVLNLLAVRHAMMPPDREHRFGHGKAEALAGLGQSAFISGSALFLLIEAIGRLARPQPPAHGELAVAVMLGSIMLTAGLVLFQHYVKRRTNSLAVGADAMHYKGDLLANVAVILTIVLSNRFGWHVADPLFALAIGGYILFSAYGILRAALDQLMDRELPEEMRRRIKQIALRHHEVRDLHDLRSRMSGRDVFIQLHLEMTPSLTLLRAHEVSDEVEREIAEAFPGAEVIIHQDPEGVEPPPVLLQA